jgi:hypothetical protein
MRKPKTYDTLQARKMAEKGYLVKREGQDESWIGSGYLEFLTSLALKSEFKKRDAFFNLKWTARKKPKWMDENLNKKQTINWFKDTKEMI